MCPICEPRYPIKRGQTEQSEGEETLVDPCFRTSLPRFLLPGSCYSFLFLIILDAPSQSALNRTLLFAAYKHSLLRRALTVLRVIAESSAVGCFSPLMKGRRRCVCATPNALDGWKGWIRERASIKLSLIMEDLCVGCIVFRCPRICCSFPEKSSDDDNRDECRRRINLKRMCLL